MCVSAQVSRRARVNDSLTLRPLYFCSTWAVSDKQELIDLIETVYRGASKGRGLVVAPKGESRRVWTSCDAS